jgi:uncharacterized protein YraI
MTRKFSTSPFTRPTFFASIAVIGLIFTLSSFVFSQAQAEQATAIVTAGQSNLREGPGAGYRVVATVNEGDVVTLLGRDRYGAWAQVELIDGTVGWLSTRYLVTDIKVSSLPLASSTAEPYAIITTGRLNMRTGPGINYPIAFTLSEGDVVTLMGRNFSGRWVLTRFSTYVGWINTGYVSSGLTISSLPIKDILTETSPPDGVVPYYGTGIVVPPTLDVTQGPDLASGLVISLPSGTQFLLAGRNKSMSRIKIVLSNGQVGWVSAVGIGSSIPFMYLPVMTE